MNRNRDKKIIKEFGKRLKKFRKEKEISIRKLGDIADMDFSQIHRIEKGETNPTLTTIMILAAALQIDARDLLPE